VFSTGTITNTNYSLTPRISSERPNGPARRTLQVLSACLSLSLLSIGLPAEVAAYVGDTFWSVEARIPVSDNDTGGTHPFKKVEGRKPTAMSPWYFNVCRQRMRDGKKVEADAFSPSGQSPLKSVLKLGELILK